MDTTTRLFQSIHEAVAGEYYHDMERVIANAAEEITELYPAMASVRQGASAYLSTGRSVSLPLARRSPAAK
jgi:hypothetical protein